MSQLTPEVLKRITETRLKEAKLLFDNGYYDGAIYLCGYAVEAALKAMVCKTLGVTEYPGEQVLKSMKSAFYTHELDNLKILAGLTPHLNLAQETEPLKTVFQNWSLLSNGWKSEMRYEIGIADQAKADVMLKALEDPSAGFISWIKTLW